MYLFYWFYFFYNIYNNERNGVAYALPSDKRNIDIIHGVKFGTILKHIYNKNKDDIDSWINGYEKNLTDYLNRKHNSWKKNDPVKYCTNLNYILDYIVQGINNLNMYECVRWTHFLQQYSMDTLHKYHSLNCKRDLDNYKNKHLFFKKLMLDLCEDIEYIKNKKFSRKYSDCPIIISRLEYRKKILMDFFYTLTNKSIFELNDACSIDFIHKNISSLKCNEIERQPNTTGAPKLWRITTSSSADRENPSREERIIRNPEEKASGKTNEQALETDALQNPGHDDDLNELEPVDPIPEDLTINLPVNDDPPKLDTTYAAASLAGISLFGTILYKYGPFRSRLNSLRGARNGSNVFPLDNNMYDANIMNNFEYLQTGIPNGEYQVGYSSITDY
ncbi:PIR protein [Plasmodium vivax]|uniref:VIR protein n=1 Tax=Plasmodium vivax TaxID=5855 RepID=A0A564ZSV6_PLAVI|nr:PIR protein [Plasmodium vivax]